MTTFRTPGTMAMVPRLVWSLRVGGPTRSERGMPEYLSPIEAIMWRVGQDATLRMTVGALLILDAPPTTESLIERLSRAAETAPRLSQRPDDATGLRSRPAWVEDPDPASEHHVRSLSVASPGSMRQVLDLVGLLESIPFDPERSPWDLTLIEGLDDGRAALYVRAHHAITDGLGGIRMLGLLLDEPGSRRGPHAPPPAREQAAHDVAPDSERPPGTLTVTIDLPKAVRRFLASVNRARDVDPVDSAVRGVQRALDVANSVSRQLIVTEGPMSSRPSTRSMLSRFEVISVSGARQLSLALGGSRNDLLVAAAAAGLGAYHESLGEPCVELRLATPTSQRHRNEAGGNWFAPTRVDVPTSVDRPGPQFGVVAERLAQAREEPALRVASTLAATIGRLPSRVLLPALHAQADSVDFAATTLPGLRGSRHICGARIDTSYPLGPRLGCPMNITAFGDDDRLDVGIALDPMVITQPDLLVECLTNAFASFAKVAGDGAGKPRGEAATSTTTAPGGARPQRSPARREPG
jgi:diacylglycerol O-acyltransferase